MAGADTIVFNTLERALSGDVNNLESVHDRTLLESFREMFSLRTLSLGNVPADAPRDVVLGGLEVGPSGSDIAVAPGTLLQEEATLVPVPGALDCSYRIGTIRTSTVMTMPVPGADSYVLIEGQMVQVVAETATRDIFDPVTQTFTPTLVDKRLERRVAYFQTTGVTNIPAPTAGRVPIAAVFRPSGGGAVTAAQIIDLRPLWNDTPRAGFAFSLSSSFPQLGRTAVRTASLGAGNSNLVNVSAHGFGSNGREMFYTSSGDIDITAALYSAGYTAVASTWRYLYLCPWRELSVPANWDPAGVARGVLVISDVAPSSQGNLGNGSALTLPSPFNSTVATGRAVCVGALFRSAANDGWVPMVGVDGRFRLGPALSGTVVQVASPTGNDTVNVSAIVPRCARSATFRFTITGGSVTAIYARPVGGGTYNYDGGFCSADGGGLEVTVPLIPGASQQFDVDTVGGNPTSYLVQLVGWAM